MKLFVRPGAELELPDWPVIAYHPSGMIQVAGPIAKMVLELRSLGAINVSLVDENGGEIDVEKAQTQLQARVRAAEEEGRVGNWIELG